MPQQVEICEYHSCDENATTYNTWPTGKTAYLCAEHLNGALNYLLINTDEIIMPTTIHAGSFIKVETS